MNANTVLPNRLSLSSLNGHETCLPKPPRSPLLANPPKTVEKEVRLSYFSLGTNEKTLLAPIAPPSRTRPSLPMKFPDPVRS